jgi:hypothetical protein
MKKKQQDNVFEGQGISPLANDKTYGERKYNLVFNHLINFWLNLSVSAMFTYWVTHSIKPIKLPFREKLIPAPSEIQQIITRFIHGLSPMNFFGPKSEYDIHNPSSSQRATAANTLSNVLTLVTAGHFIMIPSVWLGAKIKAPFVEYFNRRHYGDAAMEDPSLVARHKAIEMEERPTLLGAIFGRIGTVFATQFTGYTIGNSMNVVGLAGRKFNIPGLRDFPGIDAIAETAGNKLGEVAMERAPGWTANLDETLRENGYSWSKRQLMDKPERASIPYRRAPLHFGKYLAQDVLYTFVTAGTIAPAINFLKKYLPGMTYMPKVKNPITPEQRKRFDIDPHPIADKALDGDVAPTKPHEATPHIRVNDIHDVGRVKNPNEHLQQAGS